MKILILLVVLISSSLAFASSSFEIPRSSVVELKEPSSERIYPLFVKLPRSYKSSKDKKYPVIYLTDAWYSFQVVSGATRFPMNSGVMEEAIIVGVSYSKGSKGASSRIRDYTPIKDIDWKKETGNAAGHAKFIRELVFPYIDTKYRSDPARRTFVGNSLGGLFGAYILFDSPDMFSSYILGSPSVWFKDNYILSVNVKKSKLHKKVFISVGGLESTEKEGFIEGAMALLEKIRGQSGALVKTKFYVIDGAKHATAFPSTAIQGLDWIHGNK